MDDEVFELMTKAKKYKAEIISMWDQMRESYSLDKVHLAEEAFKERTSCLAN